MEEKFKELKENVTGKMEEENKEEDVEAYEIHRWHGFAGGVYFLKVEIGSLEEMKEISQLMRKPLLWDPDKKRYKILDGGTAYIYQVED